jgi:hypothetical protein
MLSPMTIPTYPTVRFWTLVLASFAFLAPGAHAAGGPVDTPPSAKALHPCPIEVDGLHPWKELNDETGIYTWGTHWETGWWGKGGSCYAAHLLASASISDGGPTRVLGSLAKCGSVTKDLDGKTDIDPFVYLSCHVRQKKPHRDFHTFAGPDARYVNGFGRFGVGLTCGDQCPEGPSGVPEQAPDAPDIECRLLGGGLSCVLSNDRGAGVTVEITVAQSHHTVGHGQATSTGDGPVKVKVHGNKPLRKGLYEVHIVVRAGGQTQTDARGELYVQD